MEGLRRRLSWRVRREAGGGAKVGAGGGAKVVAGGRARTRSAKGSANWVPSEAQSRVKSRCWPMKRSAKGAWETALGSDTGLAQERADLAQQLRDCRMLSLKSHRELLEPRGCGGDARFGGYRYR